MEFIKNLLGIKKLETRINQNEKQIAELKKPKQQESHETKILQILKNPTSTTELFKKLKLSRSHTSRILNKLEKQNKIYEHSQKGRTIFYKKR